MEKRKFINTYGVFCGLFTVICQNESVLILGLFVIIEGIDMFFEKKMKKKGIIKKHILNIFSLIIAMIFIRFVLSLKSDLTFLPSVSDTLVWSILASFGIRDLEEIFEAINKLGGHVPLAVTHEFREIEKDIEQTNIKK